MHAAIYSALEKLVSNKLPASEFYDTLQQGPQNQPGDGPAKLSTISRITGTQASRGSVGMPPRKFLKIRCPNMIFLAHFRY